MPIETVGWVGALVVLVILAGLLGVALAHRRSKRLCEAAERRQRDDEAYERGYPDRSK